MEQSNPLETVHWMVVPTCEGMFFDFEQNAAMLGNEQNIERMR